MVAIIKRGYILGGNSSAKIFGVFLWQGKPHCALIATPNVDNVNRRQKKGKS
jgi:hypothetical protein